uniref:Uncharacterized protein n=1 Tax=Panagrellus redivivus TaxID=6233 RepID=A0A7E4UT00_PANRE
MQFLQSMMAMVMLVVMMVMVLIMVIVMVLVVVMMMAIVMMVVIMMVVMIVMIVMVVMGEGPDHFDGQSKQLQSFEKGAELTFSSFLGLLICSQPLDAFKVHTK